MTSNVDQGNVDPFLSDYGTHKENAGPGLTVGPEAREARRRRRGVPPALYGTQDSSDSDEASDVPVVPTSSADVRTRLRAGSGDAREKRWRGWALPKAPISVDDPPTRVIRSCLDCEKVGGLAGGIHWEASPVGLREKPVGAHLFPTSSHYPSPKILRPQDPWERLAERRLGAFRWRGDEVGAQWTRWTLRVTWPPRLDSRTGKSCTDPPKSRTVSAKQSIVSRGVTKLLCLDFLLS